MSEALSCEVYVPCKPCQELGLLFNEWTLMDLEADGSSPERKRETWETTAAQPHSQSLILAEKSEGSSGYVSTFSWLKSDEALDLLTRSLWMLLSEPEQWARWIMGQPRVVFLMVSIRPESIKCMANAQNGARTSRLSRRHFLSSWSMSKHFLLCIQSIWLVTEPKT